MALTFTSHHLVVGGYLCRVRLLAFVVVNMRHLMEGARKKWIGKFRYNVKVLQFSVGIKLDYLIAESHVRV